MRLDLPGQPQLTYCTNVHPGESWPEVRATLAGEVCAVRDALAPGRAFGVGLRLSARAAEELRDPAALADLQALLAANALYVFTLNGFPYGAFHGVRVKERAYRPDWREHARLEYADALATTLAALLPEGGSGTVSTVPVAFWSRVRSPRDEEEAVEHLLRHLAALHRLRERTGKTVAVALEPEPFCALDTVAAALAFLERRVLSRAALDRLALLGGIDRGAAEQVARRHATLCLDVCHLAVSFDEPEPALRACEAAGVGIGKIQLGCGLVARPGRPADRAALTSFADDVYLHQVFERGRGGRRAFVDLPDALAALGDGGLDEAEWRIHFHVPVFRPEIGPFATTQPVLRALLADVRRRALTAQLEVETYAFGVLPPEHRGTTLVTSLVRELRWVLEELGP